MRRYELHNAHWAQLDPLLPHCTHHGGKGRPWSDHHRILHGILWVLHTGAPWRDLPPRYGPWPTVYGRFNRWRQDGTWNRILARLRAHQDRCAHIRRDLWCIDSSVIRATHAAAGARHRPQHWPRLGGDAATQLAEPKDHALGMSRGGWGTKVHLAVDSAGRVLSLWVSPGQRNDGKGFEPLMRRVLRGWRRGGRPWPRRLGADKQYSQGRIRRWLGRRRIEAVIAQRSDQRRRKELPFDREEYRRRNIIERVVGWYKECRRLVTRFEKLAVNFVAFWLVAIIERILRKDL